jgi:hypothetical protein
VVPPCKHGSQIYALFWGRPYYVAWNGNCLATFRDSVWVPSSRVKKDLFAVPKCRSISRGKPEITDSSKTLGSIKRGESLD